MEKAVLVHWCSNVPRTCTCNGGRTSQCKTSKKDPTREEPISPAMETAAVKNEQELERSGNGPSTFNPKLDPHNKARQFVEEQVKPHTPQ